jgi:hypothetical protein
MVEFEAIALNLFSLRRELNGKFSCLKPLYGGGYVGVLGQGYLPGITNTYRLFREWMVIRGCGRQRTLRV